RHRWRSIPHLVFDANFATNDSDYDSDSDSESSEINKVMLQVYQTLLLHDGPIHKFELSIPNMNRCPQLHQLLLYLSTKSVNQLSLVFHHFGPYISLPSSIFAFPNLTSLKLQSFTFQLPNLQFAGFSKLAFVELNDVRLPIDFFENFISKCPLLQDLRVFDCDFGNRQESVFVSSSSVKVLIFRSSHPCTVRFIYTPSLSVLAVQQSYYHSHFYYYLNGILFGNFQQDMVALFNSLPALEHLNLGLDLLLCLCEGNDVPHQLPAPLPNLKVLQIPRLLLGRLKEARVFVCLLKSSPNLHKLTIGLDDDDKYRSSDADTVGRLQELLEPEGVCCLEQLEEFNIYNGHGSRVELDLVRFVLATAPKLKTVFIRPKKNLFSAIVTKLLVEVTQYKRISQVTEVKFLLPNFT
ncbi:F-box/FBD/LRR-repeat protein At1g13570, partial [Linum grandiflorum]